MIESGDYLIRPVTIRDEYFFIETLADYPLGSMTPAQVRNELSTMLYVSRGFDMTRKPDTGLCMVIEFKGELVGFRYTIFKDGVAEVRMLAMHPDYRGQGHQSTANFMFGWWYFQVLNQKEVWFEAVGNETVTGATTEWRAGTAFKGSQRKAKDGMTDLNKTVITAQEFAQIWAKSKRSGLVVAATNEQQAST